MTTNPFDLTDRVALITGSRRGIGLALARALGQAGAHVVLNARSGAELQAAADQLRAGGIRLAQPMSADRRPKVAS